MHALLHSFNEGLSRTHLNLEFIEEKKLNEEEEKDRFKIMGIRGQGNSGSLVVIQKNRTKYPTIISIKIKL